MTASLDSMSGSLEDYVDIEPEYTDVGMVLHFREISVVGYSEGQVT